MKIFVAVSFCVLAALASLAYGDATSSSHGADGFRAIRRFRRSEPQDSEYKIESATRERCCYIADIEMFLPILFNGTEFLRRESTDLIGHITKGCNGEPSAINNVQFTKEELRKHFNEEDTEDILLDIGILKREINILSCNVGDYMSLLPTLMYSNTEDERFAAYDLLMISIERCNSEFRPGKKQFRHCALDTRQKWNLFFQWMEKRYMDRVRFGRKRVSTQML